MPGRRPLQALCARRCGGSVRGGIISGNCCCVCGGEKRAQPLRRSRHEQAVVAGCGRSGRMDHRQQAAAGARGTRGVVSGGHRGRGRPAASPAATTSSSRAARLTPAGCSRAMMLLSASAGWANGPVGTARTAMQQGPSEERRTETRTMTQFRDLSPS